MVNREPVELLPTMKVSPDPNRELDLPFKECQVKIEAVRDVAKTEYGPKVIVELTDTKEDFKFSIFLNNDSIKNLNEAWGKDDAKWIGKMANLKKERNTKFKKDMIVVHPVN